MTLRAAMRLGWKMRAVLAATLTISMPAVAEDKDDLLHYKGDNVEVRQLSDYEAGAKMHAAGNIDMAITMFKQGVEKGDPKSQFALATYYYFGEGVEKDFGKAHALLQAASKQGDADADTMLGIAYRQGDGVAADPKRAAEYLTRASNACRGVAQNQLAIMLYSGEGVAQDKEAALQWLYLAAESGNEDAADGVAQVESELTPAQVESAKARTTALKQKMRCEN